MIKSTSDVRGSALENDANMAKDEEKFVLVEASKISFDDEFMKHEPEGRKQRIFYQYIKYVLEKGVKDFCVMKGSPSFVDEKCQRVDYVQGKEVAKNKSCEEWQILARRCCPKRNSRLGSKMQYVAFAGVIMKKLVESGVSVDEVWSIVCDDSQTLRNRRNAKKISGKKELFGYCDLANISRIIVNGGKFELASGKLKRKFIPFTDFQPVVNVKGQLHDATAWIVVDVEK